ncbi:hypothetical protein SLA2020_428130 [Shorea laevis]
MMHLPASTSDHNPFCFLLMEICLFSQPFKFEEFWTRDSSSHLVIAEAWRSHFIGSAGFILSKKFKASKAALKNWNVTQFGNIHLKIKSILAAINSVQCAPPSSDLSASERKFASCPSRGVTFVKKVYGNRNLETFGFHPQI